MTKNKVEVKVFKGPNFKTAERKAYALLHNILSEKALESEKKNKKESI